MIYSATGHRTNKLGGYSQETNQQLLRFATKTIEEHCGKYDEFVVGGALGWDTAMAEACIWLGYKFTLAIPFEGQEKKWPLESQRKYNEIRERATKVHVVCKGLYHPGKMQVRNEWMVNNSNKLIALWDGTTGGTFNCINYADKVIGAENIIHVWEDWLEFNNV